MLPTTSCHEEINVIILGAIILERLSIVHKLDFEQLIYLIKEHDEQLSIDHVILTCDWLYIINAIDYDNDGVFINAA